MPTVFTRIINGELPGVFVWEDDQCVAFLSIGPLTPGHVLVVPRAEVDHWIDLDVETNQHLIAVAQRIARAVDQVYRPEKVGLMIAGLEVPHVHMHVVPMNGIHDLDFANAKTAAPEVLEAEAVRIRAALTDN
jgi:histidine triad (HIT) family protein